MRAPPSQTCSPQLLALIPIVGIGLALRIVGARGGLWVDEAWSAELLRAVRTPLDILLAINHDNNHHLNSLWMWLVGYAAPPLLVRALSIATGTLAIVVAAAIGWRTSAAAGLIAASLFAVSPMMVNYGSEARGYMPMLLALMTMIWLVARWLDTPDTPRPAWRLALLALLGLLAQLTMVFGLCALAVWVATSVRRVRTTDAAVATTLRLFLPSALATIAVFALVFGAAAASPTGMQVGDYTAFSATALWTAVEVMVAATLGGFAAPARVIAIAMVAIIAALAAAMRTRDRMAIFYIVAILGLPVALAVLRVGNTGFARYLLLSSLGLLLLVAGRLAAAFAARGLIRTVSAVTLAVLLLACVRVDLTQAALSRGDTGAAIATMAAIAPGGASVLVEHLRPVATLRVAAAERGYRLRIVDHCPAPMFAHVDLAATPASEVIRCGGRYRLLVVRRRAILSGVDWALYGRADLPEKYARRMR